ncbi:TPA_asm: L [Pinus flexilis virus 1]|uniref:Replicase n=1 Tax=Pinus flexilis virus 1 TaxID=2793737 RepID=A0A8D9PGU3_9RHAB|nr:L [Pinus flexilis virus 1] [Pinus flexilis virus 1]DAF42373.1 TPA_asm: L [Pinus flexilis virus 1]
MDRGWSDDEESKEAEIDDRLLCDLHLNSALNIDHIRSSMGEKLKYRVSPNNRVKRSIREGKDYLQRTYPGVYNKQMSEGAQPGCITLKVLLSECVEETEEWRDDIAATLLQAVHEGVLSKGIRLKMNVLESHLREGRLCIPKGLRQVFGDIMSLCLGVSELIRGGEFPDTIHGNCRSSGRWASCNVRTPSGENVMIATDGTTVHLLHNEYRITTWEDLLAILDTVGQRICSFMAHRMAEMIGERGGVPRLAHIEIIKGFDKILLKYQNDGYKVVSMFETLCVSTILRKNPDNINDHLGLYRNLYSELSEITEEVGEENKEAIIEEFDKMYSVLEPLDNYQLSSIFCEYRIWGHPYVDIYDGMKKIHKIGTKVKPISSYIPQYMVRIFKEYVVTGYYKKKQRYPKAMTDLLREKENSYIKECILGNRPVEKYAPGYILEDWDDIELTQFFEIPGSYDITHILNDKAISPKLSELTNAVRTGVPLDRMEGRRGILAWLRGNTINCKEFLKTIEKDGLSRDDLVIGMSEKEREMKNAARMFSLMSELMRYYFVITEGLIADYLLEFFPQITMKDSLNKLQKRLWTAGTKGSGKYDTNVNIDFSKWNTNMRSELMTPLFAEMDKLFGLKNVISRTHSIFTESLVYSCSGKYMPHIEDDQIAEDPPMCYRGHLGGMEGLRQKGWTIGTVCLIEFVARLENIKYNLMGQGDNQIIKLKMPERKWLDYEWEDKEKETEARRLTDGFVENLEKIFAEVGLPVKPKECWRSHRLFMYGKAMLLDNDVLSQWLKKILRAYAMSNEGVLTLGGTIGTIASNCMSSCSSMESPELGYSIYLLMGVWTLRFLIEYHPFCRVKGLLTHNGIFSLPGKKGYYECPTSGLLQFAASTLLVPSVCGGSINIPFTTYVMRGFPDPASEAYSWLKMMAGVSNSVISLVCSNFYGYIQPPEIPLDQLAASPLSINHWKVLAPNLSAKQESLEFLRKNFSATNNIIACDQLAEQSYKGRHLSDYLCTDPLNPLILSELVSVYPHSVIRDLVSRVQTTSTIKKLSIKTAGVAIIKKLQRGEIAFLSYLKWRSLQKGKIFSTCATSHVRKMREIGWGREIIGVTTPHPLECSRIGCQDTNKCETDSDYIYILRQERGGFAPYLGSIVKNKVQAVGDQNVRTEPLIRGLSRIASYANWLGLGRNYKGLIEELGSFYGGNRVSKLIEDEFCSKGNYTGSMDHRLRTGTMAEGCFINYAPQVGTRIFMSTDNMIKYGRGNTNYTLQFQALFCWTQIMAQKTAILHHGHSHIICEDCVVPVEDRVPDIAPARETVDYQIQGPLLDILGVSEAPEIEFSDSRDDISLFFSQKAQSIRLSVSNTFRLSLTICTSIYIAKELMGGALEESPEIGIGLADLQKYPRIYGKKIFTDELIEYVSLFCLILGCIQRKLGVDGVDLYRTKRYVLNRLSHIPSDRAAGLGSLVIDRCLSDAGSYSKIDSSGACFPISLKEHLSSALSTLKRKIQSIGSFQSYVFPRKIDVPVLDMSPSDWGLLLIAIDIVKFRCRDMLSSYSDELTSESLLATRCFGNHQRKIINAINPIDSSLDRAFKVASTVTEDFFPDVTQTVTWPTYTHRIQLTTSGPNKSRVIDGPSPPRFSTKDLREITLPTSSVYKWEEFSSVIPSKKYMIVLGDGTGTSSYTLANRHHKSFIFPMSLIERTDLTPQDLGSLRPPVTRGVKNISVDAILEVEDDIDSPTFVGSLTKFLRKFPMNDVIIISDIEMRGGSIMGTKNIRELIDTGYMLALKVYRKELIRPDDLLCHQLDSFQITYTGVGNIEYGEALILLKKGKEGFLGSTSMEESYRKFVDEFSFADSQVLVNAITLKHDRLRQLSLNLSIRYLESLGLTLTPELCCTSWSVLSMYFLNFINNHYVFSADNPDSRSRRICPRRRREIERLLGIILLITTDRGFIPEDLEEVKMLHLKDGISKKYPYKNAFFIVPGYKNCLKGKDKQVSNCLKNLRERKGCSFRRVCRVETRMSERSEEMLGFLCQEQIGEWSYLCSSTFESGTLSDISYI